MLNCKCACVSLYYERKVCDNYSNIPFLIFYHNIPLWKVLVGAAKPGAVLWVERVNEPIKLTRD